MNAAARFTLPPCAMNNVLFPTALSGRTRRAYAHALRIAMGGQSTLDVLHVTRDDVRPNWTELTAARGVLTAWKAPGISARMRRVLRPGIAVNVHSRQAATPTVGVMTELADMECDLVVLPTRNRGGVDRLLCGSVAERIARNAGVPTLFLPHGARDLVDPDTGKARLTRVLMAAVGDELARGIKTLGDLAASLGVERLVVEQARKGPSQRMPSVSWDGPREWSWDSRPLGGGNVAQAIAKRALDMSADLVVMVTRGHNSLSDVLWGSTTEQVLRQTPCPVLAVPAA